MESETITEKTGPKGEWLVVSMMGGRYIVRTEMSREAVLEAQAKGGLLKAVDCFEFMSQLQVNQIPNPQRPNDPNAALMSIGKMNLVYRMDAMLSPMPISFALHGSVIYWLDDLTKADADSYKELIQNATKMANGWREERLRNASGIVGATSIPRATPPGGSRA